MRSPAEQVADAAKALSLGDVDALLRFYEQDAVLSPAIPPGAEPVRGIDALRDTFGVGIAMGMALTVHPQQTVECGDIVLVTGDWTATFEGGGEMSGTFSDVLCRQPDGTWLYVIDNPKAAT